MTLKKKILIIEDEKILSEMYAEKFKLAGFEVVLAPEAEDGLEIAQREKPDMIILDILLPKGDGISFLQRLREKNEISLTPVVVFSNFDDPATKKAAFRLGAKDYLIKTNFTPREIIEKIKTILSTYQPWD
jgi:two-component system, OmpR family, alkaline phosphatase synthesis response regulator PhoP